MRGSHFPERQPPHHQRIHALLHPGGRRASTSTTYSEATDPHHAGIDYSTLATALAGLATPCRITVAQLLPLIYVAWWDSDQWFPLPEDPDGNTEDEFGDPPGRPRSGNVGDSMDLTGGSLSAPNGPNLGDVDNGDFNAHTSTRSGSLLLTIA